MEKQILIFILTILTVFVVKSQDELDFKPRIDLDDGMAVTAPDTSFHINFRFRMQNRLGVFTRSITDLNVDEVEARVRRLRLRMDGFLLSPKFSYYIQLSFSRGDQDWENTRVPNVVRDAVLFYFFTPNTFVTFGQTKLPGNRQRVISSGMQQFVDRSIVNATFNIDRDFGFRAYHEQNFLGTFLRAQAAISSGEGRNALNSDNGLAYTGRLEWLPFGKFKKDGDYFEGDLLREDKPRLSMGSTISYNEKAIRTGGQIGVFLNESTDIRTFIADATFKYRGFSAYAEYIYRTATKYEVVDVNDNNNFIYAGEGMNFQTSYLFKNNYEVALRYANIKPLQEILPYTNGFNEMTLGITKYFNGHRIKAQINLGYQNEHFSLSERFDRWVGYFQFEVGI